MANHKDHSKKASAFDASQSTKKLHGTHNRLAAFMERIHSVNSLHFFAGLSQVFMGLAIIGASILGLIRPLWASTLLSILASVGVMLGIYLCYSALSKFTDDTLLRDAMRRIVEDQN